MRSKLWIGLKESTISSDFNLRIVTPGEYHAGYLFDLIESVGVAGNLTTDANLAALSIEYRAELASSDADLGRFAGLRWSIRSGEVSLAADQI